ncbi:MAG: ribonuclease P protein component 2 [Candidatus Aenigmarchaeota archaeon]|nr:ribonuclease P protein component 2 [Candidatus Aenigmarchaeota archaeon]
MEESKPKFLPPILRLPKRYIVFEVISEKPVGYGDVSAALWESMLEFLGELSSSETRIWFVKNLYSMEKQRGIIKCAHSCVEQVRAAMALVQVVGESKAVFRVIGVTGTIKSARTKYLGDGHGI